MKIDITSGIELINQVRWFTVSSFTARFRIEGECYTLNNEAAQFWRQEKRDMDDPTPRLHLTQWAQDHLEKPHNIIFPEIWGLKKTSNFIILFEDEADAMLFFLTFK